MSFLKDYEPVEDRLRAFWEQHPQGRVTTELLHHADGAYIVIARVYRGDELRDNPPAATGLARDAVGELAANLKHSALEICETSAIGRALANLGYAPKGKRPSREEMQKSANLEPSAVTEPSSPGMGNAEGAGSTGGSAGPAPSSAGPGEVVETGGEAVSAGEPSPGPASSSEKSDLSFHPNTPHRMVKAPEFPDYLMCAKRPCNYWEYVGKEDA